jgi:hypothetical protein
MKATAIDMPPSPLHRQHSPAAFGAHLDVSPGCERTGATMQPLLTSVGVDVHRAEGWPKGEIIATGRLAIR